MFYIPDVNFFNGFNMILNENVIECFLEEGNTKRIEKESIDFIQDLIQEDYVEKVYNVPIENTSSLHPQMRTYEYKQTTKKVATILNKSKPVTTHKKHSNK
jgi:hypothetical protein